MRHLCSILILVVVMFGGGCSSRPPADVDAAVRQRLMRYSDAWARGDDAGVRESFHPRNADEAQLIEALAELAPAQAALRWAYQQSRNTVGQALFEHSDASALMIGPRPWESYARAAAHPQELRYKKPLVIARVGEASDLTFRLRNVDGDWKLGVGAFLMGDEAPELTQATRRQVRHTNEMTAALRSRDKQRVRRVMMRQLAEARDPAGPEAQAVLAPATRATENPP